MQVKNTRYHTHKKQGRWILVILLNALHIVVFSVIMYEVWIYLGHFAFIFSLLHLGK